MEFIIKKKLFSRMMNITKQFFLYTIKYFILICIFGALYIIYGNMQKERIDNQIQSYHINDENESTDIFDDMEYVVIKAEYPDLYSNYVVVKGSDGCFSFKDIKVDWIANDCFDTFDKAKEAMISMINFDIEKMKAKSVTWEPVKE